MNQKLRILIYLMVALIIIATYAGESTVTASTTSTSQNATVTINEVITIITPSNISLGTINDTNQHTITYTNVITDLSNKPIDIYTKASNTTLTSTNSSITDTITALTFTPNNGAPTQYTTTYQSAYANWPKPNQGSNNATWKEVITVTVPSYTEGGTFQVNIYNTAVPHGSPAPT